MAKGAQICHQGRKAGGAAFHNVLMAAAAMSSKCAGRFLLNHGHFSSERRWRSAKNDILTTPDRNV